MKKKIAVLLFCLLGVFVVQTQAVEPKFPGVENQGLEMLYNGEASRFLIHMAHAGWSDEIIAGHFSKNGLEMVKLEKTDFKTFATYGQLMGYRGIYSLVGDENKALLRISAYFENADVDIFMEVEKYNGKYLINRLVIDKKPASKKYDMNNLVC